MTDVIRAMQGNAREVDAKQGQLDEFLRDEWQQLRHDTIVADHAADEAELACVERRLKRLSAREKQLTDSRDKLRARVLASWEERGVTQVRLDDVLLHIRSRFVPQYPQGQEVAIATIKAIGGDIARLVKEGIVFQTMAAFLKESQEEDRPLPPQFEGVIEAAVELSVAARVS